MMFYNPHSFDHMKDQLDERRLEIARNRLADTMDRAQGHPNVFRDLAARVGGLLVRVGTWLEQPGQRVEQAGG